MLVFLFSFLFICDFQVCLWTTANKQEGIAGSRSMRVIADTDGLQQQGLGGQISGFIAKSGLWKSYWVCAMI